MFLVAVSVECTWQVDGDKYWSTTGVITGMMRRLKASPGEVLSSTGAL